MITSGPRLGFGAWAVGGGGWGPPGDEQERLGVVVHARDRGVTFFDTAPAYGNGASEALLGRALRAHRDAVTIATKVGPHDDPRTSLESSLRRLHSDYVDLVQLHEASEQYEWSLEKLHKLRDEGKALAVGLCNATHRQITRGLEIAPLVAYQAAYNLFDRDAEQRDIPLCRERDLGFLAYRPLASGLLTGKYTTPPEFPESDHRSRLYWFRGREFERRRTVIERLRAIADRQGVTMPALALAWVLARPGVSMVLAGARSGEQVDQNLTAQERPLEPGVVEEIDAIVAEVFRLACATAQAREQAKTWAERERFIVERLDGHTPYEAIAAAWTDRGEQPMIAAQVKVFVDQLADQGLVATDV